MTKKESDDVLRRLAEANSVIDSMHKELERIKKDAITRSDMNVIKEKVRAAATAIAINVIIFGFTLGVLASPIFVVFVFGPDASPWYLGLMFAIGTGGGIVFLFMCSCLDKYKEYMKRHG